MAEKVRQLNLPNAAKVGRAGLNLSRLGSLLSPAALYTAADLGTEYFTGRGISERFGEFGGELLGEALYGDGNLSAFSEEELAQIQQGSVAPDTDHHRCLDLAMSHCYLLNPLDHLLLLYGPLKSLLHFQMILD